MDRQWSEFFRTWSGTPEHRAVLDEAQETIAEALATHRRPYVAYSGGKDSTVLVHLVLAQAPDTLVLHWDYGRSFVPQSVFQEILENARRLGVRNLRVETSPLYAKLGRRATNVLGRHYIGRLLPRLAEEGYDLAFVALRAEESVKRRHRIATRRSLGPIDECWPLASWSWRDVWAYIVANDLPYLSLYDARAELVGYHRARFTTLFDPEFADVGNESVDNVLHWRWRHDDPSQSGTHGRRVREDGGMT
jgi:3'-phosphoadenosine 5'-phosphosulfate sulfotransferase (PAPS reductase)/FAD synthetase